MASLRSIPNGESHSPTRCDTNAGPNSPDSNDQTVSVTSVVRIETAKSEMPGIGVFPKGPCLRAIQAVVCDLLTQVAKLRQFARVPHRACKNYKPAGKSAQRLLRRIVEGGYTVAPFRVVQTPAFPAGLSATPSLRGFSSLLVLSSLSAFDPTPFLPPPICRPEVGLWVWRPPPLWGDAPPGSP